MPNPFTSAATGDTSSTVNNLAATGSVGPGTVVLFQSAGAALRNFLTGLQLSVSAAVVSTISILDGVTTIWQITLPAAAATVSPVIVVPFLTPLKGSANSTMSIVVAGALTTVQYNAQGYSGSQ